MATPAKRRSRIQISLRMLLIVVAIMSLVFGYQRRYGRQHRAAERLEGYGAKITYHRSPVAWVPWLGDKVRDVEAVDLSHRNPDAEAIQLLIRFPRLQRLYLARTQVSDDELTVIARLRNLRRLAVWGTRIRDPGVEALAGLENLQALDVHATSLSEKSLDTFATLPQLRELKFDFRNYSDQGLRALSNLPPLDWGELHCRGITDDGLDSLGQISREKYRITRLRESEITDDALLRLADDGHPLPVGPALHIVHCPVSDRILDALPWDSLTDVRFIGTQVTLDAVVDRLGSTMKVLYIGDRGFSIAQGRVKVNQFRWESTGTSVWFETDPNELTAEQLAKLPNLTAVTLARTQSAGDLLGYLKDHPHITHFEMQNVPMGTPVIKQISTWKQLREARINCCNPRTDFDLQPLENLKELRKLEFFCAQFGDEAFATFGRLPNLRELHISGARRLTGAGLSHLRNLKHLELLDIQSSADWNAEFGNVMALEHVNKINLISVRLSEENVKLFESRKGRSHIMR